MGLSNFFTLLFMMKSGSIIEILGILLFCSPSHEWNYFEQIELYFFVGLSSLIRTVHPDC